MLKTKKHELKLHAEKQKKKIKRSLVIRAVFSVILIIGTVLSYVYYGQIFGEDTIFTAEYDYEFLTAVMHVVPKVVESWQIITIGQVVVTIAMFLAAHTIVKSRRGITVMRLICSLIRCVVAIVGIIVVLAVWGVDTTALITGAGVLKLVLGLGLQSLIADVVAG